MFGVKWEWLLCCCSRLVWPSVVPLVDDGPIKQVDKDAALSSVIAETKCRRLGGHLVAIDNLEEDEAMWKTIYYEWWSKYLKFIPGVKIFHIGYRVTKRVCVSCWKATIDISLVFGPNISCYYSQIIYMFNNGSVNIVIYTIYWTLWLEQYISLFTQHHHWSNSCHSLPNTILYLWLLLKNLDDDFTPMRVMPNCLTHGAHHTC